MTAPASLAAVGFGKEATFGTAVAPSLLVPVTSFTGSDQVVEAVDQSWRGAPAASFGHTVTEKTSAVTVGGLAHPDILGFGLAGVLGDVHFTSGSPNTTTFALLNSGDQQPPSHTVTVKDPVGQLQYTGCRWSHFEVDFDAEGTVGWQGTLAGLAGVSGNASMPAASTETAFPGWCGQLKVTGVTEPRLLSGAVTFDREVDAKKNLGPGVVAPYQQRSGVLTVAGNLQLVAAADTYRGDLLAGTSVGLTLTWTKGSGSSLRTLILQMSKVTLTGVDRDYGQKWIELAVTFEVDADTTDIGASGGYSPVLATLKNTVGTGIYG